MARNQPLPCVILFLCVLNIIATNARIFSKNMEDFNQLQQTTWNDKFDERGQRLKREDNNFTTNSGDHAAVHSQKSAMTRSAFWLHGVNDNQVLVHWTGPNNDVVFILTRQRQHADSTHLETSRLWRSADFGENYEKISLPDDFKVNIMFSSAPNKTRTILSDQNKGQLFITKDTGATWKTVTLNFNPHKILPHPTESDLMLAYDLRQLKLYVTEDFGESWSVLKERVTERFFWGVEGVDADSRTVHMQIQDVMGPSTYYACTAPDCEMVPVDTSIGNIDFYSLIVEREYIFVQKSVDDQTSLYVSHERGTFKKAFFPNTLNPLGFNIVDTTDNQVFIVVDHEDHVANLYLSDMTGQFYVTSMTNVVGQRYPGMFDVDIVKVKGLKGVYLLNKFEGETKTTGAIMTQRTYITFNKGGHWRLLSAPQQGHHQCADVTNCHLHLHVGLSNKYMAIPPVVSLEQAPGLILAHGSRGTFLDFFTSDLYISRDAGLTWTASPMHGKYFLNVLDQGSIIAAISAEGPTNQVHYSLDEGSSWVNENLTDAALTMYGVVNEPGSTTFISIVFGRHDDNDDKGWAIIKLDYTASYTRQCAKSDFEQWSPAADLVENEVKCVMGEHLVYERRKQTKDCYYGDDYERPTSVRTCICGSEDFECDFGYERAADGITCQKSDWFDADLFSTPQCVDGKYNKSSGYRRVASSSCEGGITDKYMPTEVDCPLLAPRGLTIHSATTCIQLGATVTFTLKQESGSVDETVYKWSFGNLSSAITRTGLSNAAQMTKTFPTVGNYNITVLASNRKGKATAVLSVKVEEVIESILVEIPWGVRIGRPSYFYVTALGSSANNSSGFSQHSLHYAWQFTNTKSTTIRQLTWQNVLKQKFDEAGEYVLTVNVYNSVSSVFYSQTIQAYENVTTVRVHFSQEINNYNSQSLSIRQGLAEILCHIIAEILMIRRTRIILSVPAESPIVADVTVLPRIQAKEVETDEVVHSLIHEAKQQYLAFPLFTSNDVVRILDAGILNVETHTEISNATNATVIDTPSQVNVTTVQQKHSLLAVYVSLPIVVLVVSIAMAVIVYYKKKLNSHKKYYPIVKHRSRTHHDSTCSCGEEDILGMEDPEDIIIPDNEYPDNEPTLMILNEPRNLHNNQRSNNSFPDPRC